MSLEEAVRDLLVPKNLERRILTCQEDWNGIDSIDRWIDTEQTGKGKGDQEIEVTDVVYRKIKTKVK